jgi:hypothetical protein
MACKITQGLINRDCTYSIAGVQTLYLANYYPPVEGEAAVEGAIAYQFDEDGMIQNIYLPTGESFYEISGSINTIISCTDALLVGGNGGKYRQHTVNYVLDKYDADVLNEGDALSLGKFIAVALDKSGRIMLYGRTSGLTAPAGGFDYNTGATEADATGWTGILQGVSMESAPLLESITVIKPVQNETVTP